MSAWWFRHWKALFIVGLLVRLPCLALEGTQDTEFWKAWGTAAVRGGVTRLYGAPDEEIVARFRAGQSYREVVDATQNRIPYEPYDYWRREFPFPQPPLYAYVLYAATSAYAWLNPALSPSRWFYVFLNLPPLVASLLTAWLVFRFAGARWGERAGAAACLLFWWNPAVILNSPIQGYQDPIVTLLGAGAIVSFLERRPIVAACLAAAAMMHKPQGVLAVPLLMWLGLREYPLRRNVYAWASALGVVTLTLAPFVWEHRTLSMLLGVSTIQQTSHDLSRQVMNPWWIVQYAMNVATGTPWAHDRSVTSLNRHLGFNVEWLSLAALLAFVVLLLRWARDVRELHPDAPERVLPIFALVPYAFYTLKTGVQINHAFLLIPLLALGALASRASLTLYVAVSALFAAWDVVFYGLGRDFNPVVALLSRASLGWITVVMAAASCALFVKLCGLARPAVSHAAFEPAVAAVRQP